MWMLRNYGMQGIFDKIAAILIGRPRDYSEEEKRLLHEKVISVVSLEFDHPDLPIIANMDFGHTDPQWIIPLGIQAQIDCRAQKFTLLEKMCKD